MSDRIYLSAPDIRDTERAFVQEAIDTNWIAPAGPQLEAFEAALADRSGRRHAVALASGTAAIHLALLAHGISQGDLVMCSTLTFIGSCNPIVYAQAEPVFVDAETESWNIDPGLLEQALDELEAQGRLPRACIVVDLFGNCADYDVIEPLLTSRGVVLIEDAAEAVGASRGSRPAGSFGDDSIFSFNGNKLITAGSGGAFLTDSSERADYVRYLSTQAREPVVHYEHLEVGYNYRMSGLSAAFGRGQLATLEDRIAVRARWKDRYREGFAELDGIDVFEGPPAGEGNHWLTCATVDSERAGLTAGQLVAYLNGLNIEARPVWKPMHQQPVFAASAVFLNGSADALFDSALCLPSGSGMSDADVDRVVAGVQRAALAATGVST